MAVPATFSIDATDAPLRRENVCHENDSENKLYNEVRQLRFFDHNLRTIYVSYMVIFPQKLRRYDFSNFEQQGTNKR
jgi:hypothetical protein